MFSKDISHYRATPRTLQSSKFGPYSRFDAVVRHPIIRWLAEACGYIVFGLFLGAVIASVMYGVYEMFLGKW